MQGQIVNLVVDAYNFNANNSLTHDLNTYDNFLSVFQ